MTSPSRTPEMAKNIRDEKENMTDLTSLDESLREKIARIIDPEAWEEYLLEDGRVDQEVASIFQDAYEDSLARAVAILSLLPVGGERGSSNANSAGTRDHSLAPTEAEPSAAEGREPKMWTGQRNPSAGSDAVWDQCRHDWREVDSASENAVACRICGVPGDLNRNTGEVYWPAT